MAIDYDRMPEKEALEARKVVPIKAYERIEYEKPKNKYRAVRTEYNGIKYDSKAEAEYAATLALEVLGGNVAWWLRQANIQLGPDFKTKVDFVVAYWADKSAKTVSVVAIEVKGAETREFRKVRELWPKYATIPLHIVKKGNVEVIERKP